MLTIWIKDYIASLSTKKYFIGVHSNEHVGSNMQISGELQWSFWPQNKYLVVKKRQKNEVKI